MKNQNTDHNAEEENMGKKPHSKTGSGDKKEEQKKYPLPEGFRRSSDTGSRDASDNKSGRSESNNNSDGNRWKSSDKSRDSSGYRGGASETGRRSAGYGRDSSDTDRNSSGYKGRTPYTGRSSSDHPRRSSDTDRTPSGYKGRASDSGKGSSDYSRGSTGTGRSFSGNQQNQGFQRRDKSGDESESSYHKKDSAYPKKSASSYDRSHPGYKNNRLNYKDKRPRIKRTGSSSSGNYRPSDGPIRLNRYLAISGICSRRQADQYITEGLVSVNGSVITELGVKVNPGDLVKFNGETIKAERKVYLLLNKPKDYITTAKDNEGRKTVYDLIQGACPERVFPVGRLDRNSMGVIMLTNDGELAAKLSHPKFLKKKIYHVFLDKNLKPADYEAIEAGLELNDGFIKPDELNYVNLPKKDEVGIEIHSGKNRIVRRIFEHLGYKVIKLDRVFFAGLTKKNLQRGKWRFLTDKEVSMLKMNAFE